ncbi:MAG: Rrf2 family transcriptional regulator [Chlorobi bacterium]|nr:Rrf2 family transcriptional regulator [Chlorobiota bacterium]
MIKLSKKVEYGILAVRYIASQEGRKVSAKEMSEKMNVSFEFLSKGLQKLMREEIILSHQGKHGGYLLAKSADSISIADIIEALDGRTAIVDCFGGSDAKTCDRTNVCSIKKPLMIIQKKIETIFDSTSIEEIIDLNDKNHPLSPSFAGGGTRDESKKKMESTQESGIHRR